jgi:two-component system, OmpR family, response regulator
LTPRRLLLLDPDPSAQGRLAGLLKRDDREIEEVSDSRLALDRIRSCPFDVMVAGGANGLDPLKLLRRVRSIRPETKVILTGESTPGNIIQAIRQRAFSYFHPPLPTVPLQEMVQHAIEADTWQDDIRVISARPEWIILNVRCKIDAADRTTHFLREIQADLPSHISEDIAAAFRELLMNAIEHGGKNDPKKRVRASLVRLSRAVIVHITDPGAGFSMGRLPHAAISNPDDSPIHHIEVRAEEGKRPGGFGILLTKNLVNELLYNERGNSVLFVKYL